MIIFVNMDLQTSTVFKFVLLILHLNVIKSLTLSENKIILPTKTEISATYILNVKNIANDSDICISWESSHPNEVSVEPIAPCAAQATLKSLATDPPQHPIYIWASVGAIEANCEVRLARISSLQIVSNGLTLYPQGAPSLLKVLAYNDQGELLTTLSGANLVWKIIGEESVLRLEKTSSPGEVLVEAREPGKAQVEVSLSQHGASAMPPAATVDLEVVDYLEVRPSESPLLLIPGSIVPLSVVSFPKGRPQAVEADKITVEIEGQSLTKYDPSLSIVEASSDTSLLGLTSQLNIRAGQQLFTKQVQLAAPASLKLVITPSAPEWNLVESTYYTIQLQIYDEAGNLIHVPNNLVASMRFPSKHFNVIRSAANGTHYIVQTLVPGLATIRVEASGLLSLQDKTKQELKPRLQLNQQVHILQGLQVLPSVLLLPQGETQVPLKVSGGSGSYSWTSSSPLVASLASDLTHISTGSRLGEATITVTDLANPDALSTTISVSIQEVAEIDFAPTLLETYVESEVILPLMLYGYEDPQEKRKLKAFDNCTAIPLKVEVVDPFKFKYLKNSQFPPLLKSCRSLVFKCRRAGHTRVYVTHEQLRTTAVLACHKPLKPVHPLRAAVLAVGTSMEAVFEGGPRPWPMYPGGHYLSLTSTNASLTSHIVLADPYRYNKDLHIFRVTCNDYGETTLEVKVGNQPSGTNPSPAKEESSSKLVCGVPATAHLRLRLDGQILRNTTILLPEVAGKTLDVDVWMKDSLGRKFSNMTSLALRWAVSDPSLARMANSAACQSQANGAAGYRKLHRDYQTVALTGSPGPLTITVEVNGYKDWVDSQLAGTINPPITASLSLNLVSKEGEESAAAGTCDKDGCPS